MSRPGGVYPYLRRLRRRARLVALVRASWLALGAGALLFLAFAYASGPVAGFGHALGAWVLVVAAAAAAAFVGCKPLRQIRGPEITNLLGIARPELVSATRSAVELESKAGLLSSELISAHRAQVDEALVGISLNEVVPWSWLRAPVPIVSFVIGAASLLLVASTDRGSAGAFALLHPSSEDDGVSVAEVAPNVRAELLFPEYAGREPEQLEGMTILEAPKGTTVRWFAKPRFEVVEAVLLAADQEVSLSMTDQGWLSGQFVVRQSGDIVLTVTDADGRRLRDSTHRTLQALDDNAPEVTLLAPETDLVIELEDPVPVHFEARDDVGLAEISLVVETADGDRVDRVLERFERAALHLGRARVSAAELGARPGDQLQVWVEAKDGDMVSGPNIGRSERRIITIASEASRRAELIGSLEAVLDAALNALADRLEATIVDDEEGARARFERVSNSCESFAGALAGLANQGASAGGLDSSVLQDMERKLRRDLATEARLHQRVLGPRARRVSADEKIVERLEDESLRLADMLGRSRLEDASAIARELENLRREMTSLLAELRRADTEEARRELLAAMRRARARLQELSARMAAMGQDVPREFLNADAFPEPEASQSALDGLEQAIEAGDLDAAERHLFDLEREIDAMAKALGGASESFAEARFGPRERAMAEALDTLQGLETEERQLAGRSERVRREAAQRALEAAGDSAQSAARGLAQRARQAATGMEALPGSALSPLDEEAYERTQQRLLDTADALSAGDLGEARTMAEEAAVDAERLARDLELSALMFPGREGQVADAARAAREAAERIHDLQADLDRAIPRLGDFLEGQQGEQLRNDARRQSQASDAAHRLAEQFETEPDGAPLSPDGAAATRAARELMERAQRALEQGDPVDASRAQEEAARQLTELRERLEQQSQDQSGGGQGEGGSSSTVPDNRERVRIPDQNDGQGAASLRRRLLDAMREGTPAGYEDSVRRYYEEWLR